MKNLAKKISVFMMVLFVTGAALTGCGNTALSDAFDKEKVEEAAKQAVSYLNDEDYESVTAMAREDLQEKLTADVLKDAVEKTCSDAGAFTEYKNITVAGQKGDDGDMAVAVVVAQYEKQKVIYTISFDTDMQIVGFYLK